MSGSLVLLHLAGAVALLVWATRMVRTGVERAYGDVLRRRLRETLRNPLMAAIAGMLLAIALQSATAVGLLAASFASSGIVSGAAGLVAVLGADLGSALVARILSFNLEPLVPLLILVGTVTFLATERRAWRQAGRILIGIGLLLLSLRLIGEAAEPLRESEMLPAIVHYLSNDPVTAFLLAALATWLFHSSVAAILLMAALAARGLVPGELGIVMVLGANLGGGVIAAVLSRSYPVPARAVPLGNLAIRGIGAIIVMAAIVAFDPPLEWLGSTAPSQIVNSHIAFNLLVVLAGMPIAGLVHRSIVTALERMAPAAPTGLATTETTALDPAALKTPSLALANATREVIGLCETVEVMLRNIIELYESADRESIQALAALDDRVDRKHAAIKLYLAKLASHDLTEAEALRCHELLDACTKLEQAADIIIRNMLVHVKKKVEHHLSFTQEGWKELSALHASVLANARLAFNLLVSRDRETALQLVQEKDRMREREKEASALHFARLRDGTVKSVETSAIHLDTIRDLKQINSLLASLAYPVLEEHGLLSDTRLKAV